MKTSEKPLPKRLKIYFTEMFPALMYMPFVVIMYLCLTAAVQATEGYEIVINQVAVCGALSAFFMMLLIRNFDDLKDYELDKNIFPDRPIPRGDVKIEDVKLLAVSSFILLVVLNFTLSPQTTGIFLLMLVYALLTFKWFFAREFHLKHVFFTMLTHQPLPIIINLYLIFTALATPESAISFGWIHFYILLIFSLPITAWEMSRKIRAATHETEYQTFSKIFGASKAAIFPLALFTIATALGFLVSIKLNLSGSYGPIALILYAPMAFYYIRFMRNPIHQFNVLKSVAMAYSAILLLHMLVQVLVKYPLTFIF